MIDINDRVELVKPIELKDKEGRKMAFYSKGETGTVTDTEIEDGEKGYYVEFDKGRDVILCAQVCLKKTDKPLVKFITQGFKEGYRVEVKRMFCETETNGC